MKVVTTLGRSSTTFCSSSRPHTGNSKTAWARSPPPEERKQIWFWLRFALRRGRFASRISSGPAPVLAASGFEPCSRTSKDRGKSRAKEKAQQPGGIIPGVRVVPLSKGISEGIFWWLYLVTGHATDEQRLLEYKDPARLDWREVEKYLAIPSRWGRGPNLTGPRWARLLRGDHKL